VLNVALWVSREDVRRGVPLCPACNWWPRRINGGYCGSSCERYDIEQAEQLQNLHICVTSWPEHDAILEHSTPHPVTLHEESGQQQDIASTGYGEVTFAERHLPYSKFQKNVSILQKDASVLLNDTPVKFLIHIFLRSESHYAYRASDNNSAIFNGQRV
jgi:hypothetical protein